MMLDFFITFECKLSSKILQVGIKYFMCDFIYDFVIYCVWLRKGKIGAFDKIVIENLKRKCGNHRNIYINLHLQNGLGMEFTAC